MYPCHAQARPTAGSIQVGSPDERLQRVLRMIGTVRHGRQGGAGARGQVKHPVVGGEWGAAKWERGCEEPESVYSRRVHARWWCCRAFRQ